MSADVLVDNRKQIPMPRERIFLYLQSFHAATSRFLKCVNFFLLVCKKWVLVYVYIGLRSNPLYPKCVRANLAALLSLNYLSYKKS